MFSSIVPLSILTFSLVVEIPTVSGVGKWCVSTVSSHSAPPLGFPNLSTIFPIPPPKKSTSMFGWKLDLSCISLLPKGNLNTTLLNDEDI